MVFRQEVTNSLNEGLVPLQAGLVAELHDLRRVLIDDLDASNEATAVFGRMLSRVVDRLDAIDDRLAELTARLDALSSPAKTAGPAEAAAPGPPGR